MRSRTTGPRGELSSVVRRLRTRGGANSHADARALRASIRSVKRLLASFDACNPIQATVKPIVFDKEQVKVVKHMHRLAVGRESAGGGAEGGAGGDCADEPQAQPSTEGNRGVSTGNRRRSASGRRRSSSTNPMFL